MYIRQVKKQNVKNGKIFYQYTLAQTARVDGKVKQRNILYLGSDPLLDSKQNKSEVLQVLKSRIFSQQDLFPVDIADELLKLALKFYEKYQLKYPIIKVKRQPHFPHQKTKAKFTVLIFIPSK